MKHGSNRSSSRTATTDPPGTVVSLAAFLALTERKGNLAVRAGRHIVPLSNLHKVYWPDAGYTKGDLLAYYARFGDLIVPYLAGRPAILKRHPNGIARPAFFQHDIVSPPPLLTTKRLINEVGRPLDYAIYTDLAALLYLVNLGTIAQNPWHSRVGDLDHPDYLVFDLDPHGAPFDHVREVALAVRRELAAAGLEGYPKTSGSTGIHIFVPIERVGYDRALAFSEQLARRVAASVPRIATIERSLAERGVEQIYVDWLQNARGKSAASVYSVRAKPGATVSAPVTWEEIEQGFSLADFTIRTMPARLAAVGDLWEGMLEHRQKLPRARRGTASTPAPSAASTAKRATTGKAAPERRAGAKAKAGTKTTTGKATKTSATRKSATKKPGRRPKG